MTRALEPTVSAPRAAGPRERDAARRVLSAAGLPLAGVDEHFTSFRVLHSADGRLAALAGTERYDTAWLLRSLVVAREFRGRGHGSALVPSVLAEARRAGVVDVFLLTPTRRTSSPRSASARFRAGWSRSRSARAPSSKAPVPPPQR